MTGMRKALYYLKRREVRCFGGRAPGLITAGRGLVYRRDEKNNHLTCNLDKANVNGMRRHLLISKWYKCQRKGQGSYLGDITRKCRKKEKKVRLKMGC